MNLKGLEAFYQVMQTGTASEAARKLFRTQPQISRLVGALEADLGFRLFNKKQMRLEPTPEAWDLFREAERYFSFVSTLQQNVERIGHRRANHIHILTTTHIATGLLPIVVSEFMSKNPSSTFVVDVLPRVELLRSLSNNSYDVAIFTPPSGNSNIKAKKFTQHSSVLMFPKEDALSKNKQITVHDLAGRDLITLKNPAIMRQWILKEFSNAGITPSIRAEVSSSVLLSKLVAKNMGVALVDWFVAKSFESSHTEFRPFHPPLTLEYAYTSFRKDDSKLVQNFIDTLETTSWVDA